VHCRGRQEAHRVRPPARLSPPRLGAPHRKHRHDGGRICDRLAQQQGRLGEGRVGEVALARPVLCPRVDRLAAGVQMPAVVARQLRVRHRRKAVDREWAPGRVQGGKHGRKQPPVRAVGIARETVGGHVGHRREPRRSDAHPHGLEGAVEAADLGHQPGRAGAHGVQHAHRDPLVRPHVEHRPRGEQVAVRLHRQADGHQLLEVDVLVRDSRGEEAPGRHQPLIRRAPAIRAGVRGHLPRRSRVPEGPPNGRGGAQARPPPQVPQRLRLQARVATPPSPTQRVVYRPQAVTGEGDGEKGRHRQPAEAPEAAKRDQAAMVGRAVLEAASGEAEAVEACRGEERQLATGVDNKSEQRQVGRTGGGALVRWDL